MADRNSFRPDAWRPGPAEVIALILTVVWLIAAGVFFFLLGADDRDPATWMAVVLAAALPVALFWVGAVAARNAAAMREETARLREAVETLRADGREPAFSSTSAAPFRPAHQSDRPPYSTGSTADPDPRANRGPSRHPSGGQPPRPPAMARATRPAAQPSQGQLALSDEASQPISVADFVQALDFPATVEDKAGFRAMRRALKDHRARRLIRASQDVLTLLAEEGVYMDDLTPDRANPETWRRFARGERGSTVAALGGIRERTVLALSVGRMRDPIFRDAAHHFLRLFDQTLAEFEPDMSDAEIAALAETRTACAFMLIGRVTGSFD